MYGFPYWLECDRPVFPTLPGNLAVDAAIVGAGIAGLKLARCLARYGFQVVVLEGSRVGDGASSRNQGTCNHSPNLNYSTSVARHGRNAAKALWQLGLENQRLLEAQIDEYQIDCSYERAGQTFLVRRDVDGWEDRLNGHRADAVLLKEDGFRIDLLDEAEARSVGGGSLYAGGLRYPTDAQFHSGRFVLGLARAVANLSGVRIFEGCRVQEIDRQGSGASVTTDRGCVSAAVVFLATNALVPQVVPKLERSMRAERGQVLVTAPLSNRPCCGSFSTSMAWWREVVEADGRFRLVFGGRRSRDEPDSLFPQFRSDGRPHPLLESEGFSPSDGHQRHLNAQLALLFPHLANVSITHRWGGLQCFTADDLPVIGCFDAERNLWGMAGFCGRGNCHSDVGAEFLAGRVVGSVSEVEKRFGVLFDDLMAVGRASANWGPWQSIHDSCEVNSLGNCCR